MKGRIDSISRIFATSPGTLYQAFMSPESLIKWMPPAGMTGKMDHFEPKVGSGYRMTLTYEEEHASPGKTLDDTDTVEVTFLMLIPNKKIAATANFETNLPDLVGQILMTWYFEEVQAGTKVTIIMENVPVGILKADHIEGLNSTLDNLEKFIQSK